LLTFRWKEALALALNQSVAFKDWRPLSLGLEVAVTSGKGARQVEAEECFHLHQRNENRTFLAVYRLAHFAAQLVIERD
jgi:hypothetical protein